MGKEILRGCRVGKDYAGREKERWRDTERKEEGGGGRPRLSLKKGQRKRKTERRPACLGGKGVLGVGSTCLLKGQGPQVRGQTNIIIAPGTEIRLLGIAACAFPC